MSKIRNLRILNIYETKGGIETHALTLVKTLKVLGHDVTTERISPMPSEDITIPVILTFAKDLLCAFFSIVRITNLVKKGEINIIHAHDARMPLILGYFVHRVTGTPLVVTIHSPVSRASRFNRLYKNADKIIVVSQDLQKDLEDYGVEKNKLICIPNMINIPTQIDTECFEKNTQDKDRNYKLLFMGRLDSTKLGFLKILLEATPVIAQELPSIQLLIVGEGSRFHEVSRIADQLNIKMGRKAIFALGYRKDPSRLINSADVVAGVGRVAIEGMAHGKPVIVGSSKTGLLFGGELITKENANEHKKYNFSGRNYVERMPVQRMAELIIDLIRDEKRRKETGEFGRNFIKSNFEAENVVREIQSIYITCLKQNISSH